MIIEINSLDELQGEEYIIYKHSSTCSRSAMMKEHVDEFAKKHPEVSIFMNVVQHNEELKWAIQDKFNIKHESPQIIIVRNDVVVAQANHLEVQNIEKMYTE